MSNRVKEIVCFRPDRGSRVIELLIGGGGKGWEIDILFFRGGGNTYIFGLSVCLLIIKVCLSVF